MWLRLSFPRDIMDFTRSSQKLSHQSFTLTLFFVYLSIRPVLELVDGLPIDLEPTSKRNLNLNFEKWRFDIGTLNLALELGDLG